MTPRPSLRAMLIQHESLKLKPYRCSAGKLTIGVGRNLEAVGITAEEALVLLDNDIERVLKQAEAYPWFANLGQSRQDVVLSMIFNLGLAGFQKFQRLHAAIMKEDWAEAANQMLQSEWAGQVGKRAVDLSAIMRGTA